MQYRNIAKICALSVCSYLMILLSSMSKLLELLHILSELIWRGLRRRLAYSGMFPILATQSRFLQQNTPFFPHGSMNDQLSIDDNNEHILHL